MSVSKLISFFAGQNYTKVDEREVRDQILSLVPSIDHFEFSEFDTAQYAYLDGMYEEERIPRAYDQDDSDYILVGYVYTRKDLDDKDYRVIVCKEMIHSLDGKHEKTFTHEAIKILSEELTLPEKLKTASCHTQRDHSCLLLALSVLFPTTTRERFLLPFQKEEISGKEISDLTDLPEEWIEIMMSPAWSFVQENVITPYLQQAESDPEGDAEEEKYHRETATSGTFAPLAMS